MADDLGNSLGSGIDSREDENTNNNGSEITTPDNNDSNETEPQGGLLITLSDIKKHLNIDDSFTADDDYLLALIDVGEEMVLKHLDYDDWRVVMFKYRTSTDLAHCPTPIIHAIKLLIGNMYMNRESVSTVSMTSIPHSYEYLLAMYKNRENYQG